MTRVMFDTTASGALALFRSGRVKPGDLVAFYETGGIGIAWSSSLFNLFSTHHTMVSIDQAGNGSPKTSAIVKDIEPGCYSPISGTNQCKSYTGSSALRPTAYCDLSDFPSVKSL